MRATAQDRDASLLMGINVDRRISYTFALGGALAGAAGTLFVQVNEQTRYDAGFRLGLIAFTAAVIGGVGNLLGAVIGGVLIGVIQALNDGARPLPRSEVDPDGAVRDPHHDDHLPPRRHLRQASAGEGVVMVWVTTFIILAVGAAWAALPRQACSTERRSSAEPPWRSPSCCRTWVHQRDRRLPPLVHHRAVRGVRPVRARPQHRRRLRRTARPRLRRLLPGSVPTPGAWLMSDFAVNVADRTRSRLEHPLLDCRQPEDPGMHHLVLDRDRHRRGRRRARRRRDRRTDAAVEERLPRPRDARFRRDPAGDVPQR